MEHIDGYIPDLINFSSSVSGGRGGGVVVFFVTLGLPGPGIILLCLVFFDYDAIYRLITILKYIDGLYPRPDLFQQYCFLIVFYNCCF